jgi:hypothetical protein
VAVLAFVDDLMDRSRISAAFPDVTYTRTVPADASAALVIVDLPRYGERVGAIRAALPSATIVAFGPHVDQAARVVALREGADEVFARSVFFRDPQAAVQTSGQGYER